MSVQNAGFDMPICKSGVYAITHIATGRCYVGSASRIRNRYHAHMSHLRRGTHHARHLQNAWNKYGGEGFRFDVLEFVSDASHLVCVEQLWIDRLDSAFNTVPYAECLGKEALQIPEVKARISASLKATYGTPERRAAAAEQARRMWNDPEIRAKMSAASSRARSTPKMKALRARLNRERVATEEGSRKHRQSVKDAWARPEVREKIVVAMREKANTPEFRESRSAQMKKVWEMRRAGVSPMPRSNAGRKCSAESVAKSVATKKAKREAKKNATLGQSADCEQSYQLNLPFCSK